MLVRSTHVRNIKAPTTGDRETPGSLLRGSPMFSPKIRTSLSGRGSLRGLGFIGLGYGRDLQKLPR